MPHVIGGNVPNDSKAKRLIASPFFQSKSLLFQFILSDFIRAFREVASFKKMHEELQSEDASPEQTIDPLLEATTRLTGSTQEDLRLFSWSLDSGVLTKLKNNCTTLCDTISNEDKDLILLDRYANRSWLLALECVDLLRGMQQLPSDLSIDDPIDDDDSEEFKQHTVLCKTLEKLILQMHRLARLIARLFIQFRDDENVIFFLVRHHEDFDELYGEHFVFKLIVKMYASGMDGAEDFLVRSYAKRGFEVLIPLIREKIQSVETV